MTDTPNVDNQAGAGADGNQPSASPQAGGSVAGNAAELSQLVKAAIAEELKPIKGEISGLYSRQDKDRNAFSEFMAEFKKQKAKGLSDEDAETAAQSSLVEREKQTKRDQIIDKLAEQYLNSSSAQPAGNGTSGADATAKVLKEAQLDANTPEVIDLIRQYGNDPVSFAVRAGELRAKMANKPTPDASASSTPVTPPASPPQEVDVQALTAEQQRLMKNPSRNFKRLAEIKEQLGA